MGDVDFPIGSQLDVVSSVSDAALSAEQFRFLFEDTVAIGVAKFEEGL